MKGPACKQAELGFGSFLVRIGFRYLKMDYSSVSVFRYIPKTVYSVSVFRYCISVLKKKLIEIKKFKNTFNAF